MGSNVAAKRGSHAGSCWLVTLALLASCQSSSTPLDGAIDGRPLEAGPAAGEGGASERQPAADGPLSLPCIPGLGLEPLQVTNDYCVAARLDLGTEPAAIALQDQRLYTLQAAGSPFLLEVREQPIVSGSQLGSPAQYFSAIATGQGKLFAADYLALTAGGSAAAVGYTMETAEGAIFWGERGKPPRLIDKATGNYRALFLDQTTLLVNGMGVGVAQEGQGVYLVQEGQPARRLIGELGTFSGHLVMTDKVLFAGGYFKEGNKIFGFTLEEVQAAVKSGGLLTPGAHGDLVHTGEVLDATTLEGDLVVLRTNASFKVVGVSRLPVTVSNGSVVAGAQTELVTVPENSVLTVQRLAGRQGMLGLLVSGGPSPQLALLRRKP